ncbi:hypothetical protein WG899_11740 [Paucibacter sp. AS339]|uniref:hypothetical protein n=1 Tax=Paucibacter hankyongi TaxID=3133434 RepID=UPI00309E2697
MSTTLNLIKTLSVTAALGLASLAQAAPQPAVAQLPPVFISGKSAPAVQVVQLPRVVVTGLSINSQMQQQLLAAAKPAKNSARRV